MEQVVNLELSLSELQTEANKLKQQMALKSAFVKLTNSETWERAQEMFPHFATEEQLTRFLNIDLKKSIPKTFSDFCHRAKCSTAQYEASGIGHLMIRGNTVSTLVSSITELNGNLIKQVDPTFTGASLILSSLPNVASAENVAYMIKEVNSCFWLSPLHCCSYVDLGNFATNSRNLEESFWTHGAAFDCKYQLQR